MAQSELVQAITALAAPLAASLDVQLWGVEVAFGPRSVLRIYVESEREGGVTIDECAELSRLLGLSLDVEDLIPGAYVLEVSSPGLERRFFTADQLRSAADHMVEVSLLAPLSQFPGRRKFKGIVQVDGEGFALAAKDIARPGEPDPVLHFNFEQAKKIRQLHDYAPAEPQGKPVTKKKSKSTAENPREESVSVHAEQPPLRPLTESEKELLDITGGSEAL